MPIHLEPHPKNEKLFLGKLYLKMSYVVQVVVGNHYYESQLGFFIPENAIVPDKLAEEMWVKGRLAGKNKNRVKSRIIDGEESNGLFYGSQGESWNSEWLPGHDVTLEVGITFYTPQINE